jgi:hypothetical protein
MTNEKAPAVAGSELTVVEYCYLEDEKGYWIKIVANRQPYGSLGPFETENERQRALDDVMSMVRSMGGKDIPVRPQ